MALVASALIGAARLAAVPLVGEEVSFITGAPLVMLSAFFGGRLAGAATIVLGSAFALLIAGRGHWAIVEDGWPRLLLWVVSALVLMLTAAELRNALDQLRRREADLVDSQARMKLLVGELEHRGRNALAIVQAMSNDVARSAGSVKAYRDLLGGRLSALATSYSALTMESSEPVELEGLIATTLQPFADRIALVPGPRCRLAPRDSLSLAMALHELATNATKYGAMSTPAGVAHVRWEIAMPGRLVVFWCERGGPSLKPVEATGFGSHLLRALFRGTPGADLLTKPTLQGLEATITLPTVR